MIFGKKSKYPIGLDISDLSLKLVQLKKGRDKIRIQALGKQTLAPGIIENGEIKNPEAAVKAINKLIAKPLFGTISTNEVVACLPETRTFIKLIEIENSPNKLVDIIEHEIEKYVPLSADEMYYDWQVIEKHTDKTIVLIGAAPQKIINQYTDLLTAAKLSVQALEIEPISVCRCLLLEESPKWNGKARKNYAIIDIGAKRTSIVIYARNTIINSISLPISGEETTNMIAKTLDINSEQAEKAKIVCGLDRTKAKGVISEILSTMINQLSEKIKETIDFYNDHYENYGPLDEILLCGGGSNIKSLDYVIGSALGVKTRMGEIFIHLADSPDKFTKYLKETHYAKDKNKTVSVKQVSAYSYATAIGLGLRNIFLKK